LDPDTKPDPDLALLMQIISDLKESESGYEMWKLHRPVLKVCYRISTDFSVGTFASMERTSGTEQPGQVSFDGAERSDYLA
jgi:hypothetical protein